MIFSRYRNSTRFVLLILFVFVFLSVPGMVAKGHGSIIDRIPLSKMGFVDRALSSPYEEATYLFGLPAHWLLNDSSLLELTVRSLGERTSNGFLDIRFNGVALETVLIDWQDTHSFSISLPAQALQSKRRDNQHELTIALRDAPGCDIHDTNAIIDANSVLFASYTHQAVPLDVTALPYPIYQHNFVQDKALLVMPDTPSEAEMQAALTIAANLGMLTQGQLQLDMLPVNALPDQLLSTHHLVFVGSPEDLSLLEEEELPLQIDELESSQRGLLQMVVSPWNEERVVLVVSGDTDEAIIKAGQRVGSLRLLTDVDPSVAFVSTTVDNLLDNQPLLQDLELFGSFADSNHNTRLANKAGVNTLHYEFFVPFSSRVGPHSALNLVFSHSALMNYDLSSMTVQLNGEPIHSSYLADDTAQLTNRNINLPFSAVRSGMNELTIEATLEPRNACYDARSHDLWFSIRPESILNIDLVQEVFQFDPLARATLPDYRHLFVFDSRLPLTAFILPSDDPSVWIQAAHLAFGIGQHRAASSDGLVVAYDEIPPSIQEDHHLIIMGKPDSLSNIGELATVLPASFEEDGIGVSLPGLNAPFSDEKMIGYLQLFSSPWNDRRLGLAITSWSEGGLRQAVHALTQSEPGVLHGDLALVEVNRMLSFNTRLGSRSELIIDETSAPEAQNLTQQTAATPEGVDLGWIPDVIAISTVMIVLIFLYAVLMERGQSKQKTQN